ncbi:MAG: hypothetical protein K0S74_1579 [Chlamydiales bacterium]|jgi:hydroxymethylpyrimidine pyrophosphatase-like HAD family hydrolase|nr:hypothetical protein [Chlamydiales bacterium]
MIQQGLLAFDLDGTIADKSLGISTVVTDYLSDLYKKGWAIAFITGRTFAFSEPTLRHIPFPYYLAIQNGAVILQMPQKNICRQRYLAASILPKVEELISLDFLICLGPEQGGQCYYRPQNYDEEFRKYLYQRQNMAHEEWIAVADYKNLPFDHFPTLKWFGQKGELDSIATLLNNCLGLSGSVIHDPLNPVYSILQVTDKIINKGWALKTCARMLDISGPLIAAGDDWNDQHLLQAADIRIVVNTAPSELQKLAHIIADIPSKNGIIEALEKAFRLLNQ